jgi:hypothetical protein
MPTFEHPMQLYALDYPEGWVARYDEKTAGALFMLAEEAGKSAVSLTALAVTGPPADAALHLEEMLTRLGIAATAPPAGEKRADGTAIAYAEGRRVVAGADTTIRVWMLQHASLSLMATHLGPGAEHPGTRQAAGDMVASLRFPEVLPPTPAEFRSRVMDVIRREYGPFEPRAEGDWAVDVQAPDGNVGVTINLENLYRSALLEPESAGVLIRSYLDRFVQSLALPGA